MIASHRILGVLGIFFIILGTLWFSFIQARCYEISPRPALLEATLGVSAIQADDQPRFRSPYAKPYHDIIFWIIAILENFTAVFYVLTGLFLIRRFVLTGFIVNFTLGLHIILIILIVGFMKMGATPLSDLTGNPNLLQIYFLPSFKFQNKLAASLSGYRVFMPGGPLYSVGVALYFYLCYFIFTRPEIKKYLAAKLP